MSGDYQRDQFEQSKEEQRAANPAHKTKICGRLRTWNHLCLLYWQGQGIFVMLKELRIAEWGPWTRVWLCVARASCRENRRPTCKKDLPNKFVNSCHLQRRKTRRQMSIICVQATWGTMPYWPDLLAGRRDIRRGQNNTYWDFSYARPRGLCGTNPSHQLYEAVDYSLPSLCPFYSWQFGERNILW